MTGLQLFAAARGRARSSQPRKGGNMYIGIGALIVIILLLVFVF